MVRTASRSTAFELTAGVGLGGSILVLIYMAIDQATSNSIRTHVTNMYSPFGIIPDPMIPWVALYATFTTAIVCWAAALWGGRRNARWTRPFSTAIFLAGTAVLLFFFMVSEHDAAILPTTWRVICLCTAIYGAIAILVAWLPATGRITQ